MAFTLTRLLYSHDEVKYSLINSLLEQKNISECYFWCSELYYSDTNDIFKFIWKVYFDFYAIYNPGLEKYIQKKEKAWNSSREFGIIIVIIYNLFHSNISSDVFLLRQYTYQKKESLLLYRIKGKGKKWGWLSDFPASYHSLVIAIHKKHLTNAALILYNLVKHRNIKEIYNILIRYYTKHLTLKTPENIETKWKTRNWLDNFHSLLALMLHLETPIEKITYPLIIKQPSRKTIEMLEQHDKDIRQRHEQYDRVYRILNDYRMYTIHGLVGVFKLNRYSVTDFKKECREKWECYAYNSLIWRERIQEFKGKIKDDSIIFPETDKINKNFYDKYDLELDEQSQDTQMQSLCDIPELSIEEWHNKIFMFPSIVKLDSIIDSY